MSLTRPSLQSKRSWEVCGEASDGQGAVDRAKQLHPDIVVMDISMPGISVLEATRQIRDSMPAVQILVLTLHSFPELTREVRDAGGHGCVLKEESIQQLIPAIEPGASNAVLPVSALNAKALISRCFRYLR